MVDLLIRYPFDWYLQGQIVFAAHAEIIVGLVVAGSVLIGWWSLRSARREQIPLARAGLSAVLRACAAAVLVLLLARPILLVEVEEPVRGTLGVGEPSSAVWVPKDAIVSSSEGHHVFAVTDDFSVRKVPVNVGRAKGLWQEVSSAGAGNISSGDRVVTHGNEDLQEGRQVRAVLQEYPNR